MNEHASVQSPARPSGAQGVARERTWFSRALLVSVTLALLAGDPATSGAENGEPVSAEGLYRTTACSYDFAISCDDRPRGDVVSCHMRGRRDEGLAINACIDGRVTTGVARGEKLEEQVRIVGTDFGEFFCGKEPDEFDNLIDFCVVCDTVGGAGSGKKKAPPGVGTTSCVKITNDQRTSPAGTCGAFSVSNDTSGLCLSQAQDLQQSFSDPHLGFAIGIDASDAGKAGAKDLLLCGRSWQCVSDRSVPLAIEARQVQRQQGYSLIDTPCCIKLASGAYYCSSKLTSC